MSGYQVDLDELSLVVAEMTACQEALQELAGEVEGTTAQLHEEWAGLARDAHLASHTRWRGEFADMSEALLDIRDLGGTAHANYAAAVEANVAMWRQVG